MVLQNVFFGTKSSLVIFVLYVLWWRVLYTITKIGQLATNVPIFLGISFLLFVMVVWLFIKYRRLMKKYFLVQPGSQIEIDQRQFIIRSNQSVEPYLLPITNITKIKETKKWYFLYLPDKTFIPLLKETGDSAGKLSEWVKSIKPARPIYWKWVAMLFLLATGVGGYSIYTNAVNLNGALAWKINELKTDTGITLEENNFYKTKLDGILDSVKQEVDLEPYLMTDDLEIEFTNEGTITSIYTYIYGFDENMKLQSGYLIYYDATKDKDVTVHKQDWQGQGTTEYNPENDLSIVIDMLTSIPVQKEVENWNEENAAIMYKGIRNWGYNLSGIRYLSSDGTITIPETAYSEITGPTISLYVPGKEDTITPERYVYRP